MSAEADTNDRSTCVERLLDAARRTLADMIGIFGRSAEDNLTSLRKGWPEAAEAIQTAATATTQPGKT